jgi:CBS domain containing-hemolysin-like protein
VYIVGARQSIDDLNEIHELDLPESEHYTTLGGMILHSTENIPQEGESLISIHPHYHFTILKATPTKIIKVKITKNNDRYAQ